MSTPRGPRSVAAAFAALVVAVGPLALAPGAAADPLDDTLPFIVVCPPPCPALDTAIRLVAPGGVVVFQPGVYVLSAPLAIGKPLTLIGPQAGVDPRLTAGTDRVAGDAAREAILDAQGGAANVITINSDDVVIDGLELRSSSDDVIHAPELVGGDRYTGLVIANNIIHNGEDLVDVRTTQGVHVHHNRMFDAQKVAASSSNGVVIGVNTDGAVFEHNEVVNVYGVNAAVYFFGATNNVVRGNYLDGVANDDGIKIGHRSGPDAPFTGGLVANNVVKNVRQDGITIYMSNTTVSGNDVSGSLSSNGAIFVQYAVRNVSVTGNNVHDNPLGSSSGSGGIKTGSLVSSAVVGTITVSGNQLSNNGFTGIKHSGGGTLLAENNWWGHASGPKHATLNPAGLGQVQTGTNVDFTPWCTVAC